MYGEPVLRQRLVKLCPPMYQLAMDRILFNDMLLLRLMSCDHYLLHDKIGQFNTVMKYSFNSFPISEDLCREQMLLLVIDIGDWVKFPETVHELYAHLPQMIGRLFISFIFIFMWYF